MLGLAGAHRVGKSTLAKVYAEKRNWKFVPTTVTAYIRELGHESNEKFDFKTRLTIQEQVLLKIARFYREHTGTNVIVDRTPLDLMAYTLAEAIGNSVEAEDQERLKRYINDCFDVTNMYFSGVLVVQPGIPIVDADGKAAANEAYMEHLNALLIGFCGDRRLKLGHHYIPRHILDMDERVKCVDHASNARVQRAIIMRESMESLSIH